MSERPVDPSQPEVRTEPIAPNQLVEPDLTGQVLAARYRLLQRIGQGGMGTVYLAEHLQLRKRVAVKLLNPALQLSRPDVGARFLREARAAAKLRHDHVVDITDFGETPQGWVFMAMEYLEGETLAAMIKRKGRLQWWRAKAIVLQLLEALSAAHDLGIVHRDMKPENCFRIVHSGNNDHIKVLDFGIAKLMERGSAGKSAYASTATGMIMGTAPYMSPEQAQGAACDHRSDLYSVGVILFEMLTGEVPFDAKTPMGVLVKHINEPPPSLRKLAPSAKIPKAVESLVHQLLAKDRNDRPPDADAVLDAIRAIPDEPRSSLGTYAVIGGVALIAAIGWLNLRDNAALLQPDPTPMQAPAQAPAPAPASAVPAASPAASPWVAPVVAPEVAPTAPPAVEAGPPTTPPPTIETQDPPVARDPAPRKRSSDGRSYYDYAGSGRQGSDESDDDVPLPTAPSGSAGCVAQCNTTPGMSSTDRATCRLECRRKSKPTVERWSGEASSGCIEPCKCVAKCDSRRSSCRAACSDEDCRSTCDTRRGSCRSDCNATNCTCG